MRGKAFGVANIAQSLYGYITNSHNDQSTAPVSQRSWVQIPFKPEFFSGFLFCHYHSFIH